ncbi:iron chelate uptake ABC transporter family permease subunit [Microbacterium sp. STN6]|uniref:FecCD family ABC transporter permease n=1 Tax=Microbacterium sp. STN6 TaxID=2995588 RepID=UPI002260EDCC|nr:iron chelate uptake ABC transporter family permease subunit [Microbacterium sp. STN6]MCX7521837.1 iron chelate uptake ABC transporter family permease subunit [Microbacterium sp. STN6]
MSGSGRASSSGRASGSGVARRVWVVGLAAALAIVVVAGVALCLGDVAVSPAQIVAALTGNADRLTSFVIVDLRLPRIVTSIVVGLCLGLSGALFQTIARNPLASPDIIGVTAGASAAGVIGVVVLGLSGLALSGVVLLGAIAAAVAIYVLAWRGGIAGYRFVLIGIGIAALGTGVVSVVLTRTSITDAQSALVWLSGSVNGADWGRFLPLAASAAVFTAAALVLHGPLSVLELGDDLASGLGVRAERTRAAAIGIGVVLAAIAVSAAGPVAFVALVSAPIARRLVGGGALALAPSALIGGLMVLVADVVAQFAVPSLVFPVGVVTGIVGAPYLLWLLTRTNRVGRGG